MLVLLLIATPCFGQTMVEIDTVIQVEGVSKEILYDRIHSFLSNGIDNKREKEFFFKTEDREKGVIEFKGSYFNEPNGFSGSGLIGVYCPYTYQVYFKDGRLRLYIGEITHDYLGTAIDELPYPKGRKVGINGKRWFGKKYTNYINQAKEEIAMLVIGTCTAAKVPNKLEGDW